MKSFSNDLPNVPRETVDRTLEESVLTRQLVEEGNQQLDYIASGLQSAFADVKEDTTTIRHLVVAGVVIGCINLILLSVTIAILLKV